MESGRPVPPTRRIMALWRPVKTGRSSKLLPLQPGCCIQGVSSNQVGNYGDAGFHQSI